MRTVLSSSRLWVLPRLIALWLTGILGKYLAEISEHGMDGPATP